MTRVLFAQRIATLLLSHALALASCSPPVLHATPVHTTQAQFTATVQPTSPPTATHCLPGYDDPEVVIEYRPPASSADWAIADFDGDDVPDILVARGEWQSPEDFPVEIYRNDGQGGLVNASQAVIAGPIPRTQNPRGMALADFNGDGHMDVFIADTGDDRSPWPGYQNTLLLSRAGGGLIDATGNLPSQSDFTHSAAAADVDNDGDSDIYVGNVHGRNRVPPMLLLNDGQGRFSVASALLPAAQVDMNRNKYTTSLFADLNNDAFPDLVLGADDFTEGSVVLLNDGTGRLSLLPDAIPRKPHAATDLALHIAAADLNSDGFMDLVLSWTKGDPFYQGRYIQVLINNGDATFTDETDARLPPQSFEDTYWWFRAVELTDPDEDGDLDILTHVVMDQVVYENDGMGHFTVSNSLLPLPPIGHYALSDFDGDGHKDLIAIVPGASDETAAFSIAWRTSCP